MRKIIVSEMISVDGFFAGLNGEIDWHHVNRAFNEHALEQLESADTLLFGRVTYDLMANYWPTENAVEDDPFIAEKMNEMEKIVFTKTRNNLDWNNTKVLNEINEEEILKIKNKEGKNILIFGSGTIISQLATLNLIDEYRLIVNAIALGQGKTIFAGIKERILLDPVEVKPIGLKNVLLRYIPDDN